jgi:hypothetical protein
MLSDDGENQGESPAALGRAASADIALIVMFPASSDGGWLTGETIYATGGIR